jgi:hypothetical protein
MQLGDCSTAGSAQRSPLDAALTEAQQALSSMIELLEGGGLERLTPRRNSLGGTASKPSAISCRWLITA